MHSAAFIVVGSAARFATTIATILCAPCVLLAQAPPTRSLGAPTATFAEPFTHVAGVREQRDGRVIVLDDHDARIVRVDFRTNAATSLGRKGRGPGEYTLPQRLVALPFDTTLAVDMSGRGRALVITPDGVSKATLRSAGIPAGTALFRRSELHADVAGRIYEPVNKGVNDAVRRLERSSGRQDTLGSMSMLVVAPLMKRRPASAARGGAESRMRAGGSSPPPFFSVSKWTVAPDGRIAVVSPVPYQVTFFEPDGRRTAAAPFAVQPIAVTAAHKQEWRVREGAPVLTIMYGANGEMSGGTTKPRVSEPAEWPDVLPPFLHNAYVQYAPDGSLWVERTTAAGAPQTFDRIDRAGRVTSRVVMPRQTRLVGFGDRTLYAVRVDDDDLHHLQRYTLPPL